MTLGERILRKIKGAFKLAGQYKTRGQIREPVYWIGAAVGLHGLASELSAVNDLSREEIDAISIKFGRVLDLWNVIQGEGYEGRAKLIGTQDRLSVDEIEAFQVFLADHGLMG